ncbi:hypothetical protein GOV04_04245 [Candidatus Woesearchaeota archaeon]|nr:hypothetical protein [Candidatus Woesearchaeota archaeon]
MTRWQDLKPWVRGGIIGLLPPVIFMVIIVFFTISVAGVVCPTLSESVQCSMIRFFFTYFIIYLVIAIPYFFIGAFISSVFSKEV